jgi:hypothetical protein
LLNQIISNAESSSGSNIETETAPNDERKHSSELQEITETSILEEESNNKVAVDNQNTKTEETGKFVKLVFIYKRKQYIIISHPFLLIIN